MSIYRTSDLQKSRHLQNKSRHGAAQSGHKAKIAVAPPAPKKARSAFFLRLVRLQFSLCAPVVPLRDATFLQMTRLLQVTKNQKNVFLCPTSNRYHSISFVKTSAPRGLPLSGTAVLTDFLKKHPKKTKKNTTYLLKRTHYARIVTRMTDKRTTGSASR